MASAGRTVLANFGLDSLCRVPSIANTKIGINDGQFHSPRRSSHRGRSSTSVVTHAGPFDSFFQGLQGSWLRESQTPQFRQELQEEQGGEEGSTFVQLDPESDGSLDGNGESTFGPLALLAVGFLAQEFSVLEDILDEMGANEVKLVPCTKAMLQRTLGDALSTDPPPLHEPPPLGARRVVFLSGMYASEVIEIVGALRESPLPDVAFAAAVPNSWRRQLSELIEDVFEDHAQMAKRRAAAALAAAQEEAKEFDKDNDNR